MVKNPFGKGGEEELVKAKLDKETCEELAGAYDEEANACYIKIKKDKEGETITAEKLKMKSHRPSKPTTRK